MTSTTSDLGTVFDHIYQQNAWHGGSGPGSEPENCKEFVDYVHLLLHTADYKRTLMDVGCGDGRVAQAILNITDVSVARQEGFTYLGIDVSKEAIKLAQNHLQGMVNVELSANWDWEGDWHHTVGAIVLVKDVMQHLDLKSIKHLISYLTTAHLVVVCNDDGCTQHSTITAGDYRPFRLSNFGPKPIHSFTFHSVPFLKRVETFIGPQLAFLNF